VHFDIKRLARICKPGHRITGDRRKESRGVGWEYLRIAIDDHSRIAFSAILPDPGHQSAMRFFLGARSHFARFGISIRRVLTDNGSCYKHWLFCQVLHRQHVKHRFTRPYTPRTNGKAEHFIQTALREWAYARSCPKGNAVRVAISTDKTSMSMLPSDPAVRGGYPTTLTAHNLPASDQLSCGRSAGRAGHCPR
jgi:transposase InsO family protein